MSQKKIDHHSDRLQIFDFWEQTSEWWILPTKFQSKKLHWLICSIYLFSVTHSTLPCLYNRRNSSFVHRCYFLLLLSAKELVWLHHCFGVTGSSSFSNLSSCKRSARKFPETFGTMALKRRQGAIKLNYKPDGLCVSIWSLTLLWTSKTSCSAAKHTHRHVLLTQCQGGRWCH